MENLKKLKKIWIKIEIPVALILFVLVSSLTIYTTISFNTSILKREQLESLYMTNWSNIEVITGLVSVFKNLIIWMAVNWFNNNIILVSVLLILVPRLLTLPFSNKMMNLTAKQRVLKAEYLKLKKYYSKAEEDTEVKNLYTQDSMRLPKKFGIVTTEFMSQQFISFLPVIFVSGGVSQVVFSLGKIKGLTSAGIDMSKPFIPFAIGLSLLMLIQSYLPLKNTHGPTAEQQKSMVFIMPIIFGWMFYNQAALIPMVWSVSYLITLIQMLYFHRIKNYSRQEILGRL